ncbi:MAG: hypothetical protein AAF493_20710 [Pseudomonadota bacterium]
MSTATIEHNRRAVYAALSRVVEDRLLTQQSYALWEQRYSNTAVFRVGQFIDDLVKDVGIADAVRRNLQVALYAALGKAEGELSAVPAAVRQTNTPAPAANGETTVKVRDTAGKTAPALIFGELLCALADGVGRLGKDNLIELRDVIREQVPKVKDKSVAAGLLAWANSEFDPGIVPDSIAQRAMASVVNLMYVSACEVVGPAKADRLLDTAAKAANEIPAAQDFAAERLL